MNAENENELTKEEGGRKEGRKMHLLHLHDVK